jgi:hypothetical protein
VSTLHRYLLLAIAALIAATAGGCASTQLTNVYRDPDLARVPFRKVLVVFQHADPQLRRALERRMAAEIANAVPAHAIFSDEEVRNVDSVRSRLRDQGFDSTVIMRLTGVEREVSYVPGRLYAAPAYYRDVWGYWGYGWRNVYEPGYLRSDRVVNVATNVYSVVDDKLVFASQSETFNPSSLREVVSEVVTAASRATGEHLRTRG